MEEEYLCFSASVAVLQLPEQRTGQEGEVEAEEIGIQPGEGSIVCPGKNLNGGAVLPQEGPTVSGCGVHMDVRPLQLR